MWQGVPAHDLVPVDFLRLRADDVIPADAKLLECSVSLDHSALLRETLKTDAVPWAVVLCGANLRRGEGSGMVMLTEANTFFGRTGFGQTRGSGDPLKCRRARHDDGCALR